MKVLHRALHIIEGKAKNKIIIIINTALITDHMSVLTGQFNGNDPAGRERTWLKMDHLRC